VRAALTKRFKFLTLSLRVAKETFRMKCYRRPQQKTRIYFFIEEVGQKAVMYGVNIVGFYPSSIN